LTRSGDLEKMGLDSDGRDSDMVRSGNREHSHGGRTVIQLRLRNHDIIMTFEIHCLATASPQGISQAETYSTQTLGAK